MSSVLTGSKALKNSLPYGAMKEMAAVFNCTDRWIARVVAGADKGDVKILECANELADIEFDKQEEIKKVLDDYRVE